MKWLIHLDRHRIGWSSTTIVNNSSGTVTRTFILRFFFIGDDDAKKKDGSSSRLGLSSRFESSSSSLFSIKKSSLSSESSSLSHTSFLACGFGFDFNLDLDLAAVEDLFFWLDRCWSSNTASRSDLIWSSSRPRIFVVSNPSILARKIYKRTTRKVVWNNIFTMICKIYSRAYRIARRVHFNDCI